MTKFLLQIFKEKYLQHPKNFGIIASFTEKKSVQDNVQHYYLVKHQEHLKQLLRKSRQGRTRASRNNASGAKTQPVVPESTPMPTPIVQGVTTRLQREHFIRTDPRKCHNDTLIGKKLNSKMPTFQESLKTVFYTNGIRSFVKPYIAILVVNTMKVGGVESFATGVKICRAQFHIDGVWSFYFYSFARHIIFFFGFKTFATG